MEVGSIFWRLGGGEKPSRSSYAAETTVFSQFWCSKTRQKNFQRVLGPPMIGISNINRALDTQKESPITSLGREPKFWGKSDRFWVSSKEQNHCFYLGFTIVSAISAYRSIDSRMTSLGTSKTTISMSLEVQNGTQTIYSVIFKVSKDYRLLEGI